jgi:glycine/D-amino acid oxidase-like deaminating enzyme
MPRATAIADVVICGGGIAGLSSAYFLRKLGGDAGRIVVIDPRPPMSLTSSKSTGGVRNFFPGATDRVMTSFANRSIDHLQTMGDKVDLALNGYAFASAGKNQRFLELAKLASSVGSGPVRVHSPSSSASPYIPSNESGKISGFDVFQDEELIRKHFPYYTGAAGSLMHVRRAGFVDVAKLGQYFLEQSGAEVVRGTIQDIKKVPGSRKVDRINYTVEGSSDVKSVSAPITVVAVGPFLNDFAERNGIDMGKSAVDLELHARVDFNDFLGVFPRTAPFSIWTEDLELEIRGKQRRFKGGVHFRPFIPKNSSRISAIWTYENAKSESAEFPEENYVDEDYAEVILKGLSKAFPNSSPYAELFMSNPSSSKLNVQVHAGYYCKTKENRPLIGPFAEEYYSGLFVNSALSGLGIICSGASGELLAAHAMQDSSLLYDLKDYADFLHPDRLPQSYFDNLNPTSSQFY